MHSPGSRHTLSRLCCFISSPAIIQSSTHSCEAEKAVCCCTWALLRAAWCCNYVWIKDPVAEEYSRKINHALAGHCLVCAIQITSNHRMAWEPFHGILGPCKGVSNYCRSSGVCMSGEMLKGEKYILGKCHCMVICKLCTSTKDHSSFPHQYPVPFPLWDNSSFCCFFHWKWTALSTSTFPGWDFCKWATCVSLFLSLCCLSCPERGWEAKIAPWRGELFLLYYFFISEKKKQ